MEKKKTGRLRAERGRRCAISDMNEEALSRIAPGRELFSRYERVLYGRAVMGWGLVFIRESRKSRGKATGVDRRRRCAISVHVPVDDVIAITAAITRRCER